MNEQSTQDAAWTPSTVTVVGLGKIGLPLAVQFARQGLTVHGADVSSRVVDLVNAGHEPFPGETDLESFLGEVVSAGTLTATTDTASAVSNSDVVVIVVPLVVDDESRPDFSIMDAATTDVGRGLRPGTLVSYETTLPVGTTRNRFAPRLEELSDMVAGEDFHVCFSPERVYSGRIFADLRAYPKLVGGIDDASTAKAVTFYETALTFDERDDLVRPNGVWDLGTAEASELAKLAETTYRDINIGFANELARFADMRDIDVRAVIEASNSQPFSHIHLPGIAVGGHCIPVYPRFYLSEHPDARVPAAARTTNLEMPAYAVAKLADQMGELDGATVMVLGAAYRGGVKETAFSGVFGTVEALKAAGANPVVQDPLYTDEELTRLGFEPCALGTSCDGAIVQSDHIEYQTLTVDDLPGVRCIVDGRGVLPARELAAAGVDVVFIGAPTMPAA